MARLETMTIGDFMNKDFKQERIVKNRTLIVSGVTIGLLLANDVVSANTGIDAGAKVVYGKLLNVGKWVIIIKGGFDTINSVVQGDFNTAKKAFLSYLVVYIILNGLPWAMDEVDAMFKSL